jgi:hypothetical protein
MAALPAQNRISRQRRLQVTALADGRGFAARLRENYGTRPNPSGRLPCNRVYASQANSQNRPERRSTLTWLLNL